MVKYKIYADPLYLYEEYVTKRRKAADIAKEHGVSEVTIYNHLKHNGLLKYRGKGRKLR